MIEVNNVIGSIDDDKDPRYVTDGDYQYALNIRNANSTGKQLGAIENVKGTLSIPVSLPPGQNLCIGDCSDIERKHLYFFVWNSGLRHTIYQYSYAQNSVAIIIQSSVLNFLSTHYIVGARVIGNQLFFNDAFNEPRRIDINETAAFVEPPAIWPFITGTFGAIAAVLQGTTPPPFTIGQVIYVRRDFRGAWIDAQTAQPDVNTPAGFYYPAQYLNYDPNPQVSGVHTITNIIGNNVFLDVPLTNYEFLEPLPSTNGRVPGVAYLHSGFRLFNAPFQERYIKLYRPAPHFPVYTKYATDTDVNSNSVRGRLFQFKYRWVYRHGMKSHFSPICQTAFPELEKALTPFGDYKSAYDNCIDLYFDTGDTDVVGIEVAVRVMSDPADQDFYLLTPIEKENSNTSYQLRFYGNEIFRALDVPEASQPMDYIPFRANDMCLLQDKRLAVGGIEEGFDHYDVVVKMKPQEGFGTARGFEMLNPFPTNAPDDTTVTWEARFPLNRIVEYASGGFLWGTGVYPGNSAIIYPGDPPVNDPIYPGPPFLLHPGEVVAENAWSVINFDQSFLPISPSLTSAGVFTFINVKMRISRILWTQGFGNDSPGFGFTYLSPPDGSVVECPFFIAYADPANFGESFFYMSKQYVKILDEFDTPETVRDYYLQEIMSNDPIEQTFLVQIAAGNVLGDPLENWFYQVTVRLDAYDDNGGALGVPYGNSPAGGINLFVVPRIVSMVPVTDIGTGGPIPPAYQDWYRLLGVNKLSIAVGTSANRNLIGFKTGATHALAIEYRDDAGRRWPLSPIDAQYISYFNENEGYGSYDVDFLLKISNNAPIGATHYQMMYAGNSTMSKWIQFEVLNVVLNTTDGVAEVSLSQRLLYYNQYNNGSQTAGQGRSNLTYSWSPGDRMRIMTLWGEDLPTDETPAPEYIDVEVIGEALLGDGQFLTIFVELDAITPYFEELNNNFFFGPGSVVEVYSPKLNASDEEQFYYEIGQVFKITNGQHWGNQLNQGPDTPGSNNSFAQVILKNVGDAYVNIRRRLPLDYEDITRSKDRTLETSNYSDFYPSEGWGPGIPNRVDREAKREFKSNLIRFSDIYLAGTRVNNVNRFFEGNLSDEPDATHGSIQRMLCPETTLTVFQELSTGAMPVRAQELTTGQGAGVLFRADNVLGKINYYQGNFGISYHREALVYYGGAYYHPSTQNGQYMRLAQNGYFPISGFKRIDYFHDLFNFINKSRLKVRILSAYDVKYDELLVHIPDIFNLVPAPILGNVGDPAGVLNQKVFDKVTMAFSEPKKGWTTYYSFWPDNMAKHFNKLFSWKGGKFFIHDETTDYNSFHGEPQQDSKITLVFNSEPTATKFLQSMGMNSNTEPKEVVITTPYGSGQRTSLFADDFRYMENQYYAAILRNELTPDVDNPVTEGEVMRGEYFIAEVTFGVERKFELFAVTLRNTKSEMTGR